MQSVLSNSHRRNPFLLPTLFFLLKQVPSLLNFLTYKSARPHIGPLGLPEIQFQLFALTRGHLNSKERIFELRQLTRCRRRQNSNIYLLKLKPPPNPFCSIFLLSHIWLCLLLQLHLIGCLRRFLRRYGRRLRRPHLCHPSRSSGLGSPYKCFRTFAPVPGHRITRWAAHCR